MTLADEANKLRIEIVRLGAAHGRRYPSGMKELILAWIDRAKQEGMTVADATRKLGVSSKQLSTWRAVIRAEQSKALVPVQVVEPMSSDGIAFVSPSGFRIEGLTISQAIELMRAFE